MISFRIAKHMVTGEDLYEVLHDGKVCACLYQDNPDGVRIMSAHFRDITPGIRASNTMTTAAAFPRSRCGSTRAPTELWTTR
jgi:hypothetical protein